MQLHFKSYGAGEPLIILHGLFGSLENWQSVSARLADRFHVFSVDQRNHGASPHSPEMSYSIMADDLEEFMESHRLARAHVMGHSMGGKTAMQFALRYPQRLMKLIVVDIAPPAYAPRHDKIIDALLGLDLSAHQTRQQLEDALVPAIPDLGTRRFLLKNLTRRPGGPFQWRLGLRELRQSYPRLSEAVTSGRPSDKPALFISGESSDYFRGEDMKRVRELFPRAEHRTIPAAGHLPHVENQQAFLRTVVEFLAANRDADGQAPAQSA